MAAPGLRALRGLQVVRWQLMGVRSFQSQAGSAVSQSRGGKTLVSFPLKFSDGSKDSVKGEGNNRAVSPLETCDPAVSPLETCDPAVSPLETCDPAVSPLETSAPIKPVECLGTKRDGSERDTQTGDVSPPRDMRSEGTIAKREDGSSSSSSSSSDSDSEEEEEAPEGPRDPKEESGRDSGDLGGLHSQTGESRGDPGEIFPHSSAAPRGGKEKRSEREESGDRGAPGNGVLNVPGPGGEPLQEEGQKNCEPAPLPQKEGQIEEPPQEGGQKYWEPAPLPQREGQIEEPPQEEGQKYWEPAPLPQREGQIEESPQEEGQKYWEPAPLPQREGQIEESPQEEGQKYWEPAPLPQREGQIEESPQEGGQKYWEPAPLPQREGQIEGLNVSEEVGEQTSPPLSAEDPRPEVDGALGPADNWSEGTPPGPTEELAGPLAPATPAADQPLDNSQYQNLQHHSYHPFTFVDYDLELAQFRLPQPSAGRPSPRH